MRFPECKLGWEGGRGAKLFIIVSAKPFVIIRLGTITHFQTRIFRMITTQNLIGNHYFGYFKPTTQKNPRRKSFFLRKIASEKGSDCTGRKNPKNLSFRIFFVDYHAKITVAIDSPSNFTPSI